MNLRVLGCAVSLGVTVFAFTAAGCSSSSKRSGFETETDPTQAGDAGGGFTNTGDTTGGSTCSINNLAKDPDKDSDGDGFPLKFDCNECDVNINAGAFDVPGNGIDEDCNGTPDDEPVDCDTGLNMAGDAFEGAAAMGLCKKAEDDQMWGVVKAEWVKPDGSSQSVALGQGILPSLGVNAPQAGAAMLAVSSGTARGPNDTGYRAEYSKGYTHGTPAGYPKESPSCSGSGLGGLFGQSYDGAALKVTLRVPTNANSFSFQQNFFTKEFPVYICDDYNDFFVTMMDPKPAGLVDGNISFDQDSNPISVNNSFLQVCTAQTAGEKPFACPLGPSTLSATGFEDHAATGWLTTTAPVDTQRGKEITLTFAVWDQGDGRLDSTALVDDFKWSVEGATGAETKPTVPK